MNVQKTAVLVHGAHMQANLNGQTWDDITFGYLDGKPTLKGRLLMGVKVAKDYDADTIFYGTGVMGTEGKTEAEHSLQKTLELEDALTEVLHFTEEEKKTFREWLKERAHLDGQSLSTTDECRNNIDRCMEKGIGRLILVSSPWHIQRCLAEALTYTQVLRESGKTPPEILGTASHGPTEGVLVLEPSHRGDRPKTRWHELAKTFFKIPEDQIPTFEGEIEKASAKYIKTELR